MKLNKISAALLTVIAHTASSNALADTIIQKIGGEFLIVSNEEAKNVFNQNSSAFFAVPPTLNTIQIKKKGSTRKRAEKSNRVASNKPVINRPVTTVEPAESIYLRLEKKTNER